MKIRFDRQEGGFITRMHIFDRDRGGRAYGVPDGWDPEKGLVFKVVPEDEIHDAFGCHGRSPLQVLEFNERGGDDVLKDLMNHLWQMGIRPNDAEDRSDTINAMADHIKTLKSEVEFNRGVLKAMAE